ncbi:hypothetical protein J3458_021869 [Metarhizium acridum]|uniref:uncharacterized protein n=1 Tax=Metarhizium acridum TaxID=92637 RepID=UPI001C6CA86C|nr:hypothetical protein J3458_021869 [Metarhizium acridum]
MRLEDSCAGPPEPHAYKQYTPPPSCICVENTPALMQPLQASRFIHFTACRDRSAARRCAVCIPGLEVHEALSSTQRGGELLLWFTRTSQSHCSIVVTDSSFKDRLAAATRNITRLVFGK